MVCLSTIISTIVGINLIVGANGLLTDGWLARYGLVVDKVLTGNEYGRLWSASWVHTHWSHLLLNAVMLIGMGLGIRWPFGPVEFLFLYFISLFGGNLLALYTYRDDRSGQHDATGAAGGISGALFAGIALQPSLAVSIPTLGSLPVWPFAITFLVVSVFALKPYSSTMIHDAHLGGAVVGLLITPLIAPEILQDTLGMAVGILAPTVILFYAWVKAPENVSLGSRGSSSGHSGQVAKESTVTLNTKQPFETTEEEMNALLDKISQRGYRSLSQYEQARLRSISGEVSSGLS